MPLQTCEDRNELCDLSTDPEEFENWTINLPARQPGTGCLK